VDGQHVELEQPAGSDGQKLGYHSDTSRLTATCIYDNHRLGLGEQLTDNITYTCSKG
jgi:hypothetical protein